MNPRMQISAPEGRTRQVEILPDAEAVARAAADQVEQILAATPDAAMILPAGGTPIPLYRELLLRHGEAPTLSRAHFFQLDEIEGLPGRDPRSFHAFLRQHFLGALDRPAARDHLLHGDAADPVAEIARHAAALDECGGARLCLLGLGVNGHVGYNEPGSGRDDGARRITLDRATVDGLRPQFADLALPSHGITLGLKEILAADEICVLVTGASKAEILLRCLSTPPGPELPASWIADHPRVRWLADAAAADRLQQASSTAG